MSSGNQADLAAPSLVRLGVPDAGEILTLQRAAFVTEAQLYRDPWLPPLTQTLAELEDELARPSVYAWGYRCSGRLVASTRVEIDGGLAELRRTSVCPDCQGLGLGTSLLSHAENALSSTVTAIKLFTGDRSIANLRLYGRLGYVETDRTRVGAYSLVHMRKELRR
jgi:GNAT superfamily N-acetyltransferase